MVISCFSTKTIKKTQLHEYFDSAIVKKKTCNNKQFTEQSFFVFFNPVKQRSLGGFEHLRNVKLSALDKKFELSDFEWFRTEPAYGTVTNA